MDQLEKKWLDLKMFGWTTEGGERPIDQSFLEKGGWGHVPYKAVIWIIIMHSETCYNSTEDRILSKTIFLGWNSQHFSHFSQPFQTDIFKLLNNIKQRWYITWNIYKYEECEPFLSTFIYFVKRNGINFPVF